MPCDIGTWLASFGLSSRAVLLRVSISDSEPDEEEDEDETNVREGLAGVADLKRRFFILGGCCILM